MKYNLDDKECQGLLSIWRDTALNQLHEHSPQDSAAFFDLVRRIPGIFMKYHIFTIGVAGDYARNQRIRNEKSINAISRQDCIAPYLDREQLELYEIFVGLPRVVTEINYAYCSGLILGSDALNKVDIWVNQFPDDWVEGLHRSLYPLSKPLMISPVKVEKKEESEVRKDVVESEIQNEVEYPESQNEVEYPEIQVVKPEARKEVVKPEIQKVVFSQIKPTFRNTPKNALDVVVGDPFQSRAIFGAQRTGKSYFASIASRKIHEITGARIYHLNLLSYVDPLKQYDEDSTYWNHAHESLRCDLSILDPYEAKYYIKAAIELVDRCYSDLKPAILVCDEIAYLGSTGNQHRELLSDLLTILADKITVMASSGKKRKKCVWTLAPEFVAGGLTQDTKSVKKLRLLYLSIHPDRTVDWDGQDIGFDAELYDQVSANYKIYPPENLPDSDRVAFISGVWMPIGDLGDLPSPTKNKLETLSEYLLPLLENAQIKYPTRDLNQIHQYIDSVMEHQLVIDLGLSKSEVENEIKILIQKMEKVKL